MGVYTEFQCCGHDFAVLGKKHYCYVKFKVLNLMLWSCTRAWGLIWYINVHDLMLQSRCLELKSWGLILYVS